MIKSQRRPFGSIRVKVPPAPAGQRIGIMGGSFNPPHDGHLTVSRTALRRLALDRIWWVVTPGNPLKTNGELPSIGERMAACRRLIGRDRRAVVTGFEEELGTPFTAATLAFLKLRCPAVRFVWVMGADNLAGFHRWQHWTDIARSMPIAVVDRPGWRFRSLSSKAAGRLRPTRVPEERAATLGRPRAAGPGSGAARRSGHGWTLISTRLSPLSSTELRQRASRSPDTHPPPV